MNLLFGGVERPSSVSTISGRGGHCLQVAHIESGCIFQGILLGLLLTTLVSLVLIVPALLLGDWSVAISGALADVPWPQSMRWADPACRWL